MEAKKRRRAQKTTAPERDVIGFLDNMVKSDGVEICPKNGEKYFIKESFRRIYYKCVHFISGIMIGVDWNDTAGNSSHRVRVYNRSAFHTMSSLAFERSSDPTSGHTELRRRKQDGTTLCAESARNTSVPVTRRRRAAPSTTEHQSCWMITTRMKKLQGARTTRRVVRCTLYTYLIITFCHHVVNNYRLINTIDIKTYRCASTPREAMDLGTIPIWLHQRKAQSPKNINCLRPRRRQ